jgi:hypothetical protein
MIFAYPAQPSLNPGDTLVLHVSTDAPQFRVGFYRQGKRLAFKHDSGWLTGHELPVHLPYQDWGLDDTGLCGERLPGWPAYPFPIPTDWTSGVYIAMLSEGDGEGRTTCSPDARTPDARHSKALFVVRSASPEAGSSILYKLPLLTYHAYNQGTGRAFDPATLEGGWSLYSVPSPHHLAKPVPPAVSIRRPGGGTGGTPWDMFNSDPFDPTPRQAFVHWDAPFITWLEENGYGVHYCTDLDIHRGTSADLLSSCRLLVCAGHDEYWSDAMRSRVQAFVRNGGNVAFFSGNTCWYQVSFDDDHSFRRICPWSETSRPDRPENILTGVSYRNGGERRHDHSLIPVGYRVQHADHWVYEQTGLRDGESFGDGDDQHLVGYECDGADFDRSDLVNGGRVRPTGNDGTPLDFVILGIGDLSRAGWGLGNGAATMGVRVDNGTVFTASTTDWARVVASGRSVTTEKITRNVLDQLSQRPPESTAV